MPNYRYRHPVSPHDPAAVERLVKAARELAEQCAEADRIGDLTETLDAYPEVLAALAAFPPSTTKETPDAVT